MLQIEHNINGDNYFMKVWRCLEMETYCVATSYTTILSPIIEGDDKNLSKKNNHKAQVGSMCGITL